MRVCVSHGGFRPGRPLLTLDRVWQLPPDKMSLYGVCAELWGVGRAPGLHQAAVLPLSVV